MPKQRELDSLVVRPIQTSEERYWDETMDQQHYLGFRTLVGASMKYIAFLEDAPVALLGWSSAAFKCAPRDRWIGWSKEQQWSRLPYIANNSRFLILPHVRITNLASKVLAFNRKRISDDWIRRHGYPLALLETFVDHSRYAGTCYRAAGWLALGQTSGYGRNAGKYHYHGRSKTVYVHPLHREARRWLSAPFLVPELSGGVTVMDLNQLDLSGHDGLLKKLRLITDPRKARGIRHTIISTLAIAICAVLAGNRAYTAIAEWATDLTQDQLRRFGCRYHEEKGKFIAPSESTIRRHIQSVDGDELDMLIHEWLREQVTPDAIAVDGKTLRGSKHGETKGVHLLSALAHDEGTTLAQRNVDAKTNEIPEFRNMLDDVDLQNKVVTADPLHTQREHARYLVEDKEADYLFTVKDNQSNLRKQIKGLDDEDFSP